MYWIELLQDSCSNLTLGLEKARRFRIVRAKWYRKYEWEREKKLLKKYNENYLLLRIYHVPSIRFPPCPLFSMVPDFTF